MGSRPFKWCCCKRQKPPNSPDFLKATLLEEHGGWTQTPQRVGYKASKQTGIQAAWLLQHDGELPPWGAAARMGQPPSHGHGLPSRVCV